MTEDQDVDENGYPLIGPHVARELELMLAGVKPMAMFSVEPGMAPEYTGEQFEPYVEKGIFVKFTAPGSAPLIERRWYCLPGEEWRGKLSLMIYEALESDTKNSNFTSSDLHRIDGYLLGYSKECVEYFINHVVLNKPEKC
ncbi:hemin receptor [Pararhizobium sp. LjRoot235]|uniref:hemin receptor n=1 Tax=Pararhizobium sp. LjRoot235 TaxID=3342291 RepID=UPI003ECD3CAB